MALPGVTIEVKSKGKQLLPALSDGTFGLICTGVAVSGSDKFTLSKSYLLTSLASLTALGVTEANNAHLHTQVSDYFSNTKNLLWLRGVSTNTSLPDMVDVARTHGKTLIDDSNEAVRVLLVSKEVSTTAATKSGGIDAKVHEAVAKAQQLANAYPNIHLGIVLDGKEYTGTASELTNYSTGSYEQVAIALSANNKTGNAALGFWGGILSKLSVETRLSRKRSGAVPASTGYLTDKKKIEKSLTSLGVIHDRHYITYRTFPGETGVYFANDFTLASTFVNRLSRVRVVDKIKRLAYTTGIREIDEKVPLTAEGNIRADIARRIETDIEQAIGLQMTENEEISAVEATVEGTNLLQTERISVELRITAVGYSNTINYLIFI